MASSNSSSQSSSSQSQSFIPNYPQAGLLQSIAQYAGQVADSVYNWGAQQYANNSAFTQQNLDNYLNTSANALAMAQNDTQRYETKFQPEEDQLLQDANSYASPERVKAEMGAAESGVGQSFDANHDNAVRDLQSYGIDPSAGRYAALDHADATRRAAAQAGAAQQARLATEGTGRALRSEAIQVGERYPGQITNALNTSLQGYTGAQNALLANSNTGVNMLDAANPYLQTASSLKYPPLGNASQSSSSGSSSGGSTDPEKQQPQQKEGGGGGGQGSGSGGGGSGSGAPPASPVDNPFGGPLDDGDGSNWGDPNTPNLPDYGGNSNDQPYDNPFYDPYSASGDPFGDGSAGSGSSSTNQNYDDPYYDPYSAGGDYATGGAVPEPTTGGHVPYAASPSQGAQIDDVRANLNAGEFVIPRDVAAWMGQKYFQDLIQKSRQARGAAPAHAQRKPMQPGPASFISRRAA